jgi:hypothetical protein
MCRPGQPVATDPATMRTTVPMAKTPKHSSVTSAQSEAGTPAPKTSQGGYGHDAKPTGTTVPQGSRKNPQGKKPA